LWRVNTEIRESVATQVDPLRKVKHVHTDETLASKSTDELLKIGINQIADKWQRFGYRFVPLITEAVRCSIDVLFLRPEEPGFLMRGGDLDARLKTLFDALRLPSNRGETGGENPHEDEDPFFCVVEDDKLISDVHITTDELLVLPTNRELKPNDAFLVIHVKTKPVKSVAHWSWRADY
jgi:hypothetical protein